MNNKIKKIIIIAVCMIAVGSIIFTTNKTKAATGNSVFELTNHQCIYGMGVDHGVSWAGYIPYPNEVRVYRDSYSGTTTNFTDIIPLQRDYEKCDSTNGCSTYKYYSNSGTAEAFFSNTTAGTYYYRVVLRNTNTGATQQWTYPTKCGDSTTLPPYVDIKANNSDGPISIGYNTVASLTWTSSNASSCTASSAWSGSKATSGSQSTGNLTSSKTYTISCTGAGGTDSDSVTVNVGAAPCVTSAPQTQTLPCPEGQVGSITQRRTSSCPGPTWSAWVTTSNTCKALTCNISAVDSICTIPTQRNTISWTKNVSPTRFKVQVLTGASWEDVATNIAGSATSYPDSYQPTVNQTYRVVGISSTGSEIVCGGTKEALAQKCSVDIEAVTCGLPPVERIIKGLFMSPSIIFQKQ